MGERALALVFDKCGEILQYTSQWGGSDAVLATLWDVDSCGRDSADIELQALLESCDEVNWEYQRTVTETAVQEMVDYLQFETVYMVTPAGVSVYQPVWHGLSPDCPPAAGTLIRVKSLSEHRLFRSGIRQLKGWLYEFVAVDLLTQTRGETLVATLLAVGFPERAITAQKTPPFSR